jgi:two-component system, NarL family, sensor kinase
MDIISQEVTLVVISTAFFLLLAVGIVILFLVYQKKQLQYMVQKREMESNFERELLNVQLEAQEHTLNMVGLEIHDNIGQALSLVKLNLNRLSEQAAMSGLQPTKDLVSKAIQDLRMLSKTLNSNYIAKSNLVECLQFDLAMIQQSGMETTLTTEGEEAGLTDQSKLIIYRMVQELLNNTIKHAQATAVHVQVNFSETALILKVSDNGKGLAREPQAAPGGTGIGNLFMRASMINAEFKLQNGSPGLMAQLTVPLYSVKL